MGNVASSPEHDAPLSVDRDGAPPSKRRRISHADPLDVDQLIDSPKASESRSTLRIEVLKVLHKDSKKVRSIQPTALPQDSSTTKGNCRITILDLSNGRHKVLHCQSQVCEIITSKNPIGPYRIARINLPRPFFVPEESILVRRRDNGSFDFSDSYRLLVELEDADGDHWPPLDSADLGPDSTNAIPSVLGRHSVLSSEFDKIFGRHKNQVSIASDDTSDYLAQQTDYVMDVDLKWTAGFKAWKRLEKGSMPCITAIHPDTEQLSDNQFETALQDSVNGVNGANGVHGAAVLNGLLGEEPFHELDDDLDGDQTPSRSLRAREKNKSYNLKVLSDQALGRERRKRRAQEALAANEGSVTYLLPTDQPVCLDYHRCVSCGAYHQSTLQLQAHLAAVHPGYKYDLEITGQGPQFRVTRLPEPVTASPTKNFHLGKPAELFNLETFVDGDHSWINARLGSEQSEENLKTPRGKRTLDRVRSGSPRPRTPKRAQRQTSSSGARKVLIPDTGEPLFHPVSKARLRPGQEVPAKVLDTEWLLQKHRESIDDFSDVTPAEKEYIRKWDNFILQQNLTSTAYFPRAWLKFVKDNAAWLAAVDHRVRELGKHTSVLLARDILNKEVLKEAFKEINAARERSKLKVEDANGASEATGELPSSPKMGQLQRNANGCTVCRLPVIGPSLLLCSNKGCSSRLFHSDCIKETARVPVEQTNWLCNGCSGAPTRL